MHARQQFDKKCELEKIMKSGVDFIKKVGGRYNNITHRNHHNFLEESMENQGTV